MAQIRRVHSIVNMGSCDRQLSHGGAIRYWGGRGCKERQSDSKEPTQRKRGVRRKTLMALGKMGWGWVSVAEAGRQGKGKKEEVL